MAFDIRRYADKDIFITKRKHNNCDFLCLANVFSLPYCVHRYIWYLKRESKNKCTWHWHKKQKVLSLDCD